MSRVCRLRMLMPKLIGLLLHKIIMPASGFTYRHGELEKQRHMFGYSFFLSMVVCVEESTAVKLLEAAYQNSHLQYDTIQPPMEPCAF